MTVLDTRPLYPLERRALLDLLTSLDAADWAKPTVCAGWDVHDVTAHILNDYLRRVSGGRDHHPGAVFAADETLPAYLARTNDEFVRAARQCSPRTMIDLLTHLGPQLDALWADADLTGPAPLGVSWAGPGPTPAWLDIARDYTEFWTHQQQIRDAVSRPGATEPALLHPVLATFAQALPVALGEQDPPPGTAVLVEITGPAGGRWVCLREAGAWRLTRVAEREPAASVVMDQDTAWRLATRGVTVEEARRRAELRGDPALTAAVTRWLAIVA